MNTFADAQLLAALVLVAAGLVYVLELARPLRRRHINVSSDFAATSIGGEIQDFLASRGFPSLPVQIYEDKGQAVRRRWQVDPYTRFLREFNPWNPLLPSSMVRELEPMHLLVAVAEACMSHARPRAKWKARLLPLWTTLPNTTMLAVQGVLVVLAGLLYLEIAGFSFAIEWIASLIIPLFLIPLILHIEFNGGHPGLRGLHRAVTTISSYRAMPAEEFLDGYFRCRLSFGRWTEAMFHGYVSERLANQKVGQGEAAMVVDDFAEKWLEDNEEELQATAKERKLLARKRLKP